MPAPFPTYNPVYPSVPTPPCDPCDPCCSAGGSSGGNGAGSAGGFRGTAPAPSGFSANPIRYANGEIRMSVTDLAAGGFGLPWGHGRTFANQMTADYDGPNGYKLVRPRAVVSAGVRRRHGGRDGRRQQCALVRSCRWPVRGAV